LISYKNTLYHLVASFYSVSSGYIIFIKFLGEFLLSLQKKEFSLLSTINVKWKYYCWLPNLNATNIVTSLMIQSIKFWYRIKTLCIILLHHFTLVHHWCIIYISKFLRIFTKSSKRNKFSYWVWVNQGHCESETALSMASQLKCH
jgi:hypothetical protein